MVIVSNPHWTCTIFIVRPFRGVSLLRVAATTRPPQSLFCKDFLAPDVSHEELSSNHHGESAIRRNAKHTLNVRLSNIYSIFKDQIQFSKNNQLVSLMNTRIKSQCYYQPRFIYPARITNRLLPSAKHITAAIHFKIYFLNLPSADHHQFLQ